tara:strand:- start:3577 stop:4149 length:573 start_codon:yes stop_codon:yes gene_type:complete
MLAFKKKYLLIIENIKYFELKNIKKGEKFIIIYRNTKNNEKISELINFRNQCRLKRIKFFIANNTSLAIKLKADGIYLSAHNHNLKALFFRKKFDLIGSAHNYKEIDLKKKQGCKYIVLSRLFRVSYKSELSFLGINRFNYFTLNIYKKIIPLGGINLVNLNKLKIVRCNSFAVMSEIKKKPAKIISRLF